jgi:hypothetical protein
MELPFSGLSGCRQRQVAWRVYTKFGLVLVGLDIRWPSTGVNRILLSPRGLLVPSVLEFAVYGLVLASNAREAHQLSTNNLRGTGSLSISSASVKPEATPTRSPSRSVAVSSLAS